MTLTLRAPRPEDAEALAALHSLPGVRAGSLRMPYAMAAEMAGRPRADVLVAGQHCDTLLMGRPRPEPLRDAGDRA